jgi:hypothetical protein
MTRPTHTQAGGSPLRSRNCTPLCSHTHASHSSVCAPQLAAARASAEDAERKAGAQRIILDSARSSELATPFTHAHGRARRAGRGVACTPCCLWFVGAACDRADFHDAAHALLTLTPAGHLWTALQALISLGLYAMFVCSSYGVVIPFWLELVGAAVIVVDYFVQGVAAADRWRYPFTFFAIIDTLCVIPVIAKLAIGDAITEALYGATFTGLYFLRLMKLYTIVHVVRKWVPIVHDEINTAIVLAFTQIVALMLCSAAVVYVIEEELFAVFSDDKTPRSASDVEVKALPYHDCVYFFIVTLSTVGFGDISPETQVGRMVVACMIGINLVTIPAMINKVLALIQARSKYRLAFKPVAESKHSHILVAGSATRDCAALSNFFNEYFHADRAGERPDDAMRQVVVFGADDPEEDVRMLMHHPNVRNKSLYIRGTVMQEEDMVRIAGEFSIYRYISRESCSQFDSLPLTSLTTADHAHACFLFADKAPPNASRSDEATIIRALVTRNFNPHIRSFVQLILPESMVMLASDEIDTAICLGQLKMQVLAGATNCLGINTLFDNLCTHSTSTPNVNRSPWLSEYEHGCDREVYCITIPDEIIGVAGHAAGHAAGSAAGSAARPGAGARAGATSAPKTTHASLTLGGLRWGDVLLAIYRATQGTVSAIGIVIRNVTSIHPGAGFVLPTLSGVQIVVLAEDFGSATQITNAKLFRGQHLLAARSVVPCAPLTPFCPIPPRHQFAYNAASQARQLQLGEAPGSIEVRAQRRRSLSNASAAQLQTKQRRRSTDASAARSTTQKLGGSAAGESAQREAKSRNAAEPHVDPWGILRIGCVVAHAPGLRAPAPVLSLRLMAFPPARRARHSPTALPFPSIVIHPSP